MLDVVIIGAGIAGLNAAWELRDLDLEVLDAAEWIGGRTRSVPLSRSGSWANYGAQYIIPERVMIASIAETLGLTLVPMGTGEGSPKMSHSVEAFAAQRGGDLTAAEHAELTDVIRRLEAEQRRPRDPDAPEMDGCPFRAWLGDVSLAVAEYFEHFCQVLCSGSSITTSLYGVLLQWGEQRVSAFTDAEYETHSHGDCVVEGGTSRLAAGLADAIRGRVSLGTRVVSVAEEPDGVTVHATDRRTGERRLIRARAVVSSVPAPVASRILMSLPGWKRRALADVRYGRRITSPVEILPSSDTPVPLPLSPIRPGQRYESYGFPVAHQSPRLSTGKGGCYNAEIYDTYARQVWDDPDESIIAGVCRAVLEHWPAFGGRLAPVGVSRWRYGLPAFEVGRMRRLPLVQAPVGRTVFCGDYTWATAPSMETAARSGKRAAAEVRDQLRLSAAG